MKTLYLDCFSGISGDMTLGALIDAGLNFKTWRAQMDTLNLAGYSVSKKKVTRAGISGTKLTVKVTEHHTHRNITDITKLITKSKISKQAKESALAVFDRLANAEAGVHGVSVDKVHFHEVGALDSIVDIVGTAVALDMMGIGRVVCSPLNLGSGTVKCAHGILPVPAPATAELVKGFPAYSSDIRMELTTPTGAAIATTLAESFGPMPAMSVSKVGYGAGSADMPDTPNMLRMFVGETLDATGEDSVELIETNIDDMDPRIYEHVMELLLGAGALDVWLTPIIMKKSRPAVTLSVLSAPTDTAKLADIVIAETTTLGVRISSAHRQTLAREFREVRTRHGVVRVKLGLNGGKVIKAMPEYEDVKGVAKKAGRPMQAILSEINRLFDYLG